MRLLLDTHVLLWLAGASERIPKPVHQAIVDADERCVSLASAWEYSAKRARFPDRLPKPFEALLGPDFRTLDCAFGLYRYAEELPPIHYDPFDRMLVAQALELGLTLVTADQLLKRYPVATLW